MICPENRKVWAVPAETPFATPELTEFSMLRRGDDIFASGTRHRVTVEAHQSGDASYAGWLLYAKDQPHSGLIGEAYFPEDLDGENICGIREAPRPMGLADYLSR